MAHLLCQSIWPLGLLLVLPAEKFVCRFDRTAKLCGYYELCKIVTKEKGRGKGDRITHPSLSHDDTRMLFKSDIRMLSIPSSLSLLTSTSKSFSLELHFVIRSEQR